MRRLILVFPPYAEAQTYFPTSYICRSTDEIPRRELMVRRSLRSPVSVFPLRHFSSLCTMASRKLLWKRSLKQNIHFTDKKKGIVCFYYLCDINTFLFERNLWLIYLFQGIVLLLSLWSLSNWIFKKNLQSVYLRWKLFFPFLWIFGICDNGKDDFRKYEKDLSLWGVEICASLTVS